jgi:hypothetical protein
MAVAWGVDWFRGTHEPCARCPCCSSSSCRSRSPGRRRCCASSACVRAIYVTAPKACADQGGNCAGPGRRLLGPAGIRGAHGGARVRGQRLDRIQYKTHGHGGLDRHAAGAAENISCCASADAAMVCLRQPPAWLPTASSSSTERAHSTLDMTGPGRRRS